MPMFMTLYFILNFKKKPFYRLSTFEINVISDCRKGQSSYLLLFCRSTFSTVYKIRRAVEEDNDDLVPLIAAYSTRFTELYGEYVLEINNVPINNLRYFILFHLFPTRPIVLPPQ